MDVEKTSFDQVNYVSKLNLKTQFNQNQSIDELDA